MATYDGDIKLGVELETSGTRNSANKLGSALNSALSSSSDKTKNLGLQLQKVSDKMAKIDSQMRELENTKIPTEEFKQLGVELDNAQSRLAKVQADMQKMRLAGTDLVPTDEYKQLASDLEWMQNRLNRLLEKKSLTSENQQEIAALRTEIHDVKDEMQAMVDLGQAYEKSPVFKTKEQEVAELGAKIDEVNQKSSMLVQSGGAYISGVSTQKYADLAQARGYESIRADILTNKIEQATAGGKQLNNVMFSIVETSQKALSAVGGVIGRIKDSIKATISHHKTAEFSFKRLFTTLIKYGLGIRSIFFLYRRLRAILKEGLTSLGKEFSDVKANLDSFKMSFSALKSSLVSAFEPIISAVIPILVTLIDYLTAAMNALGNFFAMLTGRGYYYKAVKSNKAIAESIGSTGSAAKEANEELAEYDKLLVIDQNAAGGGGGGGGGGGASAYNWEKVETTSSSLIENLQDMWKVFKDAWDMYGQSVIDAWNRSVAAIKQLFIDVGQTIHDVFTDGTGFEWVRSLLGLATSVLSVVYTIVEALDEAWKKNNNGYNLVKSILTAFTNINDLMASILSSFKQALEKYAVPIFEKVLRIVTNISDTIAILATKIKEAWEYDGNGDTIFDEILGLVDDILADIEECSEATKEWATHLNLKPLVTKLKEAFEALRPVIRDISRIASDLYRGVILPLAKIEIEFAIPIGLAVLAEILEDIHAVIGPVVSLLDELADVMEDITGMDFSDKDNPLRSIVKWIDKMSLIQAMPGPIQWIIRLGEALKAIKRAIDAIDWDSFWKDVTGKNGAGHGGGRSFGDDDNDKEIGRSIVQGIWEGFGLGWVYDISKWCDDHIVQPIKDFFGIHSPSKLMKEIGQNIILGLWEGMLKLLNKMQIKLPKQVEFIATAFGGVAVAVANNWSEIKEGAGEMVDKTKEKIQSIPGYFKEKFNSAYQGATKAFSTIGTYFQNKKTEIQNGFSNLPTLLTTTAKTAYTGITGAFSGLGTFMKNTATTAYNNLTGAFSGTSKAFTSVANSITSTMSGAFNNVAKQWNANTAGNNMQNVANKMKAPFQGFANFIGNELGSAWSKITNAFKDAGNAFGGKGSSVYNSLRAMVNTLIDRMNSAISQIVTGVNRLIDQLATSFKKQGLPTPLLRKIPQTTFPHAARGAVIPPNKEFLAVLGDQKQGINIETPLDTMIDAFRTALREDGGGASNNAPIVLQLNGRTVAEAVWDETEKRYKQKGISGAFAY